VSLVTRHNTKQKIEGVLAMPKRVFWPLAFIIMGLIFLASNMRMLQPSFLNLWSLILIVVGLGGLLTSDREDWKQSRSAVSKPASKASAKPARKAPAKAKSRRSR
jgi:hypothetical protein